MIASLGANRKWQRAQLWLANHSIYKIQVVTDVVLQTFNPPQAEPNYGFSITREPTGSDTYVIRMQMVCGNMFGCSPDPIDVRNGFYYYLKTGTDLFQGQGYSGIR